MPDHADDFLDEVIAPYWEYEPEPEDGAPPEDHAGYNYDELENPELGGEG